MALIYDLARKAESGMRALQAAQRDWSPFLVHFTSYAGMRKVRDLLAKKEIRVEAIKKALDDADEASLGAVRQIFGAETPFLRANSPQKKEDIPACVCLSQCTLPGLFGHSERFGRFGFVFRKEAIWKDGGRPMAYVDNALYGAIDAMHSCGDKNADSERQTIATGLWPFVNVYTPPGCGGKVQDFTVEREWRVCKDLPLKGRLCAMIAPDKHIGEIQGLLEEAAFKGIPILPIDMLYEWGV